MWGFTDNPGAPVSIVERCGKEVEAYAVSDPASFQEAGDSTFVWEASLPASGYHGLECLLSVSQGSAKAAFAFTFGDVWFCSGQSNMGMNLNQVVNPADGRFLNLSRLASAYPNINFINFETATSEEPLLDFGEASDPLFQRWTRLDSGRSQLALGKMSAVCALTAAEMTDSLRSASASAVPTLGLVHSSFPGSTIEAWCVHRLRKKGEL